MIKINLLAERRPVRTKTRSTVKIEGMGSGSNILLIGILVVGAIVAGGWWWMLSNELSEQRQQIVEADAELKRLEPVIQKSDEYEEQKDLLSRKIELITDLKAQQEVPVHIMDQVSRNLPEFLWLESMTANDNRIVIGGKATTYNAVSNFYSNLTDSGYFGEVGLGRTFEVPEGVAFSLTCSFVGVPGTTPAAQG